MIYFDAIVSIRNNWLLRSIYEILRMECEYILKYAINRGSLNLTVAIASFYKLISKLWE